MKKKSRNYLEQELYDLIKNDDTIFDFIQESSIDGMWYWDLDNPENEWMNAKFWTTLGYDPEKMPHKSSAWQDIINQEDLKLALDNFNKHCEDSDHPYDQNVRYKHKDGSTVWIRCRGLAIRNKDSRPVRMLGAHHDITELKNAEMQLVKAKESAEQREAQFKILFEKSPDLIVTINFRGEFINCNSATLKFHNFHSLKQLQKYSTIDTYVFPEERKQLVNELKKQASLVNKEMRLKSLGCDKQIDAIVSVEILKTPENEPFLMVSIRDISKIKRQERELKLAKEKAEAANELKTEFLRNMSHEIRTPMNGIMGFSELLDNAEVKPEKRKYYSRIIQNSSRQLLRVIDDIIEISTLETKQETVFESEFYLNDLILETFSIFNLKAVQRNIPIYIKKGLTDKQCFIISDRGKLSKILDNLIENALKYIEEGFIEMGYYLSSDSLLIYVKDTGIGIPKKDFERIFNRFSRGDNEVSSVYRGLGLGLSIASENAKLLNGSIEVESEPGKGSRFIVKIPYKPAKEHPGKKKASSLNKSDAQKSKFFNVLIAEDDEVNFLYIETLLEEMPGFNCKIIHAKNGKEALDICMKNKKTDIVLMDLKMPEMDGLKATQLIKSKFPDLPIIVQSAYSAKADKELAKQKGCDDFISKPINKNLLYSLIRKHLE